MKGIGNSTFVSSPPIGRITKEVVGSRLTASREPPAPFAEAPREPEIGGAVIILETSGLIGPVGEPDRVREEVFTAEVAYVEEKVLDFSTELVQVLEEPLICLANVDKDVTMTGIVVASRPKTPESDPVALSFHPSLGRN
ncbi:hypothetical protein Nepgr_025609 [Nepenthes gracilis]|uniref:Uncharacterized protein n=1 Tax=Nepenthes gracilis TaxID=150966 RepID=A0AAD3T838_NEPGR|nr:hypothetical protein Nepgr_025609 [Nepenthes gracilis]